MKKSIKGSGILKCPHCKTELRESDFFRESQIEKEMQTDKKYREEVLKEYELSLINYSKEVSIRQVLTLQMKMSIITTWS